MPINLKVLLPFQVFVEKKGVKRVVAQTLQGSFGLLPPGSTARPRWRQES